MKHEIYCHDYNIATHPSIIVLTYLRNMGQFVLQRSLIFLISDNELLFFKSSSSFYINHSILSIQKSRVTYHPLTVFPSSLLPFIQIIILSRIIAQSQKFTSLSTSNHFLTLFPSSLLLFIQIIPFLCLE